MANIGQALPLHLPKLCERCAEWLNSAKGGSYCQKVTIFNIKHSEW
ncbi:unnamed protein product [Tuber melanosporum]|uniref:(Perigord truffle) hypothetical protein n=1 Tax=Tuber melanosporum (strain Mel28) TaxID=656061 RepID=D5GGX9_TUBMM|nr:uncharacterized protein GSTUM_00007605001 [Tuber melanosporum]CAZ83772.1 unnamed protein product [Tuber melanosporum]